MHVPERAELSRRESQIMEILYRLRRAGAAEVLRELPDPPSYSSVRKLLEILEGKGYVEHEEEGRRYVYRPTTAPEDARRSVLRQVLHTFFGGSTEQAMQALLDVSRPGLDDAGLDRIVALAEQAKREGR
jgi:predicted transcriptional regulator